MDAASQDTLLQNPVLGDAVGRTDRMFASGLCGKKSKLVDIYEFSCFENFVLVASPGSYMANWIRGLGRLDQSTSLIYDKADAGMILYSYITTIAAKSTEVFGKLRADAVRFRQ